MAYDGTITKIFWKRTYLFVEFDSTETMQISLSSESFSYPFEVKTICEHTIRAKLNLTIAAGRAMLPAGDYAIKTSGKLLPCKPQVLLGIEDLCRVYYYDEKQFAYIVNFYAKNDSIIMHVDYLKHNNAPQNRQGKLSLAKTFFNLFYKLLFLLRPHNGRHILFMSENRDSISDNLKMIDKRMKERHLDTKYHISYSFRNIFGMHQSFFSWIHIIALISKQDYIFVDDYVPIFGFVDLNKSTKLIQVWHGGFGFKLVGYGRFGIEGSPHPFKSCHRKYDYAIIGNQFLKEIYSEVFGIEKEALLATGLPRLEEFADKYIEENTRNFLLKKYPQLFGKKIITFAPTYRGENQNEASYDYSQLDLEALYGYCIETNTCILFKMHHFILEPFPIDKKFSDRFFEMSQENLNELFYITDILITDYSSCFYDFLLLKRPIIFYVYDLVEYQATRGVHRDVEKVAPGKICKTFFELLRTLEEEDFVDPNINDFLIDAAALNNGKASDKIIDYILLHQNVDNI